MDFALKLLLLILLLIPQRGEQAILTGAPVNKSALLQTCQSVNGGVAKQNYIVTIAGSGGTTGCTANFTSGDMIAVAYNKISGADLTTASISATGATITWRKAGSFGNTVFGPPGFLTGILYACPGDITSPTSSIAITVNMGASLADITSIFVQEISGIVSSSCLDSAVVHAQSQSTCVNTTNALTTGTASGTLAAAHEFIFVAGMSYGVNPSCTGSPPIAWTAGTSAGTLSFGNFTIPPQGTNNSTCTQAGQTGCGEFIEYVIVSTNASGQAYATQSPGTLSGNMISAGFIGH